MVLAVTLAASCGDNLAGLACGTDSLEGASCGTGKICRSNMCVSSSCGDGVRADTEECDDGNTINGDGCDAGCRFSCLSSDVTRNCAPADECGGQGTCNNATHTCAAGTPLPDGHACAGGPNNVCSGGVCKAPVCGNAVVEPGEDCDGGAGCKANCTFLCADAPATECAGTLPACQTFACTPTHTCEIIADPAVNGAACDPANPANVCVAGACQAPRCGDGVRETGEDCDDGGQINLDGCDSACKFEEDQRITSLRQQFATDAFCQQNAIGVAITPNAQPTIQATWNMPVSNGSLSIVFKFLGLLDLTGMDSPFTLGFVNASPAGRVVAAEPVCGNHVCEDNPDPSLPEAFFNCPGDCTYDGNNDLDWWYVRDPASVDASETPLVKLSGQVAGGHLTAGPGTIHLKLPFALEPAQVTLFDVKVDAIVDGPVNAPTLSAMGATPGHLASEHLSPTLTSVAGASTGAMCSNVSLASLFDAPMPNLLQVACTRPDPHDPHDPPGQIAVFTPNNRLLDAFVAGCDVFGIPGILPTQPDGSRDGATYHFAFDPATRMVTSCTKDGGPAQLTDCVNNATYSSYFKFSADRVIIKRN
jgi:cysteine-rich repeat protein